MTPLIAASDMHGTVSEVSDVEILTVAAPSLEKLRAELARALADRAAEDVVGVSHAMATVAKKQSGGIWSGARQAHELIYTAVLLLRGSG